MTKKDLKIVIRQGLCDEAYTRDRFGKFPGWDTFKLKAVITAAAVGPWTARPIWFLGSGYFDIELTAVLGEDWVIYVSIQIS